MVNTPLPDDMLSLSAALPRVRLAAGNTLVTEGGPGGAIWVLESGALSVSKRGITVNSISRPGALVGEISVLLGLPYGATVRATADCVLRHAADGKALLDAHPAIARRVAEGLAERLNFVTTYLIDLQQQYGQAPGLAMVSDVLHELAQRQAAPARAGSAREPDPRY
jgi:CRP-like cAMP-binding protein